MYHILFIHCSVDGHVGCFQALAIANSDEVNSEGYESFWTILFSGFTPREWDCWVIW